MAGGVGIWQVDERIYSTSAAAENYWEALSAGDGSAALGMFSELPEAEARAQSLVLSATAEDEDTDTDEDSSEGEDAESEAETDDDSEVDAEDGDNDEDAEDAPAMPGEDRLDPGSVDTLLLDGDALRQSVEQMRGFEVIERSDGADISFSVDEEPYETHLPMSQQEDIWFFFDDWKLDPETLTEIELSVPAAEQGGIGQIEVNGEPVNLHEDGATLATFVPSVVDFGIDSDWLTGSADEVILQDGSHQVEIELEASEDAAAMLRDEVDEYLSSCADQQVLMPTGCPMGVETPNQVDAETISWDMPDPDEVSLTFGDDGWEISGASNLTATATFDSLDHFDGDALQESEDVSFSLDVEVGASGEDLIVSVIGG